MRSDNIEDLLRDGWSIAGYSTTIMVQGAMTHSVLLRKDITLKSVTIVTQNGRETGRVAITL